MKISFIKLWHRYIIEEKTWTWITLLGQAIGHIVLANEALNILAPDILIDTHGLGFSYLWIKLMSPGTKLISYTHYPFIQKNMLAWVKSGPKLIYYKIIYQLYCIFGRKADLVLANSNWTRNHLVEIWKKPDTTKVVYPPCNVTEFKKLENDQKQNIIVSLGQFRPEKDHFL